MSDIEINFSDDNLSIDIGSDLDDNSIKVSKNKHKKKKKKNNVSFAKKPTFGSGQKKPPPQFNDKSFEMFSNPSKRMPVHEFNGEEDDEDAEEDDNDEGNFGNMQDNEEDDDYQNFNQNEYEEQPSAGYDTIEDEKQDLIYKFYRLENKGVKVSKKFNMHSDISEMRTEYKKITRDAEVNSSLKFSKRMLLAVVSGAEFLNKRYDPLGIELNGWSESVMENMNDGDYDNVFERLHDKYAGKVNTPPELELMLSLAGSAIMFHMTSTMFKQLPNMNDISKQNPEMMQNLMKSMSNMMNEQNNKSNNQPSNDAGPGPSSGGRREMKGPSMDMSQIFAGMGPPPPQSSNNMDIPFEIPESVLSDSGESSDASIRNVSYTAGGTAKRGRKPKNINIDDHNTINI